MELPFRHFLCWLLALICFAELLSGYGEEFDVAGPVTSLIEPILDGGHRDVTMENATASQDRTCNSSGVCNFANHHCHLGHCFFVLGRIFTFVCGASFRPIANMEDDPLQDPFLPRLLKPPARFLSYK